VPQLDAAEVGQRNFGAEMRFAAAAVDFGLDRPHFLVSNHQNIARAAGRVEHADAGDPAP